MRMYWRPFSRLLPLLWVGAKGQRVAWMKTLVGGRAGEHSTLPRQPAGGGRKRAEGVDRGQTRESQINHRSGNSRVDRGWTTKGTGGLCQPRAQRNTSLAIPRGVSCVNDRPTGAPHHWVVKAILDGVVPVLTGDPGIFVNAPELPIEYSLTTLYTPLEQALHAWGT